MRSPEYRPEILPTSSLGPEFGGAGSHDVAYQYHENPFVTQVGTAEFVEEFLCDQE